MEGSYDIVIVGGGVIGSASAHRLATDHDVLVLDRGSAGGETSPKASGLTSVIPDLPSRPAAARFSMSFFHEFDGTRNFVHTDRPGVHLLTEDEVTWGREHAAEMHDQGFEVRYLEADELEAEYPGVFTDQFAGGVVFADCGWVDPYTYTITLKEEAEAAGADYETGVEVKAIMSEDGQVTGVEVDGEPIAAPTVICATGWRTRDLLADHIEVPVRPFRWQTVNLEVDRDFDGGFPMGWDDGSRTYWRPEHNGDLHVGGGTYYVEDPGDVREGVTERFRQHVAETITDRIQGLGHARVVGGTTCPTGDADTPDGLPIIDEPEGAPAGLIVAVAGPVGGIMCSPFVSAGVHELVTGEPSPAPIDDLDLDRFDDRSTDFASEHASYWTIE